MKKPRFTEEQIVFALKQAELGAPVLNVCRKLGISDATFYAWRKKYGGISQSELKHVCREAAISETSYSLLKSLFGHFLALITHDYR